MCGDLCVSYCCHICNQVQQSREIEAEEQSIEASAKVQKVGFFFHVVLGTKILIRFEMAVLNFGCHIIIIVQSAWLDQNDLLLILIPIRIPHTSLFETQTIPTNRLTLQPHSLNSSMCQFEIRFCTSIIRRAHMHTRVD